MAEEYIKTADALNECDRMLNVLEPGLKDTHTRIALRWCKAMLKAIEPADVKPVVRGEWIFGVSNNIAWMKCSNCLKSQEATGVFAYCPNCGADMRGRDAK